MKEVINCILILILAYGMFKLSVFSNTFIGQKVSFLVGILLVFTAIFVISKRIIK